MNLQQAASALKARWLRSLHGDPPDLIPPGPISRVCDQPWSSSTEAKLSEAVLNHRLAKLQPSCQLFFWIGRCRFKALKHTSPHLRRLSTIKHSPRAEARQDHRDENQEPRRPSKDGHEADYSVLGSNSLTLRRQSENFTSNLAHPHGSEALVADEKKSPTYGRSSPYSLEDGFT